MVQDCIRLANNIKLPESYYLSILSDLFSPGGLPYNSDEDAQSLA